MHVVCLLLEPQSSVTAGFHLGRQARQDFSAGQSKAAEVAVDATAKEAQQRKQHDRPHQTATASATTTSTQPFVNSEQRVGIPILGQPDQSGEAMSATAVIGKRLDSRRTRRQSRQHSN